MPGQRGPRKFKAEGTALSGSTSGQWEISLALKWLMIELWAIGTEEEDGLSFRAIARRLSSGARKIHHSTVRYGRPSRAYEAPGGGHCALRL